MFIACVIASPVELVGNGRPYKTAAGGFVLECELNGVIISVEFLRHKTADCERHI